MPSDQDSDLNQYFRESPFNEWMDIRVESGDSDRSVVTVPYDEKLTNQGGSIHGGVLASLVDVAGGAAVMIASDATDIFLATTDMDIRYLRPASDDLEATGTAERVGTSLGVATVDITQKTSSESKDVAFGSVSFKLLQ